MKNYAEVSEMIGDLRDTAETQWSDLGYPDQHLVFDIRNLWAVANGKRGATDEEHRRMTREEFKQYANARCTWQVATYPRHEYCELGVYSVVGSFDERSHCREHLEEINSY